MHEDLLKYSLGNIKLYNGISLLLAALFVLQFITGLFLSCLAEYTITHSFDQLLLLIHNNWYVWVIRDVHMLCSNVVMGLLYIHIGKAIGSLSINLGHSAGYITGVMMLLISLITCFTGYVLVSGQMSYWALTVILSLASVLPLLEAPVTRIILAGEYSTQWTLSRIFVLHYLVAEIMILIMGIHMINMHRIRPGSNIIVDGSRQLLDIVVKDVLILLPFLLLIFRWRSRSIIHPDNWQGLDPISTPAHIEPEIYFLWLFCLLKSRPSKLIGTGSLIYVAFSLANVL